MLKTIDFINEIGIDYAEMLKQVSIPDFYKCIAQYSGISMKDLKDEIIIEYIKLWAQSKKPIFDFFGKKTKVDMDINYKEESKDYYDLYTNLAKKYPTYYLWLKGFTSCRENKMLENRIDYDQCLAIKKCFPDYKYNGETITHFFRNKLKAPDELVTEIGRMYENNEIKAKFTMSIDPIDIMLSSENPYDWQSCYRLEQFSESHADGCLAGVIDTPTIVTYIWNEEGKYSLYGNYDFKNIRYKRMRMTIGVNKEFNAIHFNEIYPGKSSLSEDFHKLLRTKVETYFAEKLGKENIWKRNLEDAELIRCYRENSQYGYSEYKSDNVWYLKEDEKYSNIEVYNNIITCPCGCGEDFIGSDDPDYWSYNGDGQINENYNEEECCEEVYCDELNEYMDCDGDCAHCPTYNENHAVCDLTGDYCEEMTPYTAQENDMADFEESNIISCCPEYCAQCPHYQEHFGTVENEEEE